MISSHRQSNSLSARFRQQRMHFLDTLILEQKKDGLVLIDLGGTRSFWEMNLKHLPHADRLQRIDIYNLEVTSEQSIQLGTVELRECPGNATQLNHVTDQQYDIAFSNSVLEHVGNLYQQNRFAHEIQRVAPCYILQTPNRYFPVEPHFYLPFFALLPLGIQAGLHRRFKLGWFPPEPDKLQARIDCDEIRLLTRKELKLLFPKAEIHAEWLGGLIKSFVLVREIGK